MSTRAPRAKRLTALACAAALLTLAGCSMSIKQSDPVKQYYALKADRPTPATQPGPAAPVLLKIKRLSIVPTYSSRELVYKTAENVFVPDYYNLFLVTPKDNLTQVLRDWLNAAGVVKHVVASESDIAPDYILESSVGRLYADFTKQAPVAVLEAQFFLLHDTQGRYDIVMSKTYRRDAPLKDRTPDTLVSGYNQALQGVLTDLEADLRATLAAVKPDAKP